MTPGAARAALVLAGLAALLAGRHGEAASLADQNARLFARIAEVHRPDAAQMDRLREIFARSAVATETRPLITPAWIPTRRSHWRAIPSCESKALISASPPWPSGICQ